MLSLLLFFTYIDSPISMAFCYSALITVFVPIFCKVSKGYEYECLVLVSITEMLSFCYANGVTLTTKC